MKPSCFHFLRVCCGLLVLACSGTALAQVPRQDFKAGAYRGVLQVTTTIPDVAPTTTSVRVAGRSAGDSTLQFLAPAQIAMPLLGSGDDYPVKMFSLHYSVGGDRMALSEVTNSDTAGGNSSSSLLSLEIAGGTVRAETTRTFELGGVTVTLTIRVRLVRTGK